jgi:hypothetical protein
MPDDIARGSYEAWRAAVVAPACASALRTGRMEV